ncbi:MAG TPA: ATP-binding protein [Verrucomicrobiae bacterium]|jgi:signal transduction histidine kinase
MLRTRLFLGFLPVLVILLAVGFYGLQLVSGLVGETETVLLKNYRSAVAAQKITEAAAGMDRGVLFAMEALPDAGRVMFVTNVQNFVQALRIQRENATSDEERTNAQNIQLSFSYYQDFGQSILGLTNQDEQRRAYSSKFSPRQELIATGAHEIQRLNDAEMARAQAKILQMRERAVLFMGGALAMGLVLALYAGYQAARGILRPIQSLTSSAIEVGRGNLDQSVPIVSDDELGRLGEAFNQMAEQLRAARAKTSERLMLLHHSREATLSTFPDPIFVLDCDGHVELTNPAADEMSRRLGLANSPPAALARYISTAVSAGESFLPTTFDHALSVRWEKEERFYLPRVLAMRSAAGMTVGVAVVLLDITRFRLLDEVKTDLVATVSHELKTPLTSILMVLHLLAERSLGPLSDKQAELITTARDDAVRLQRILADLLDLARLESESTQLRTESITAEELIGQALRENRDLVTANGLRLSAEVEPGLPAVEVDVQRISHVFGNFISNAVKHSPPGGTITLRARRNAAGIIRFSVADQGPGIPAEFQSRLFEKFFRVPGQQKPGAGLGLTIAREIVVAHGGQIGVESQLGRGSEFFAELPAQ